MTESLKKMMIASIGEEKMKRPISWTDVCGLFDQLIDMHRDLVTRVKALENHGVKFVGTWQRAQAYTRGHVVVQDGSSWVCIKDAAEGVAPSKNHEHWALMAKAGRDGKDSNR